MAQLGQTEMTFTELDLYRLSGKGGWVAERAALSDTQLEALVDMVELPVPRDRRNEFKFFLNEQFAEYVENRTRRPETLQKTGARGSRHRRCREQANEKPSKLSTVVREELDESRRAIRDAGGSVHGLSPPARTAILAYFWQQRLTGRTQVRPALTFRQTWPLADDGFMLLQAACERADEEGTRLSAEVRAELVWISQAFDHLRHVIEGLNQTTRELLEEAFDRLEFSSAWPSQPEAVIEDPLSDALDWMSLLMAIAEYPWIEVKRGRDEAPEKVLVGGLAGLHRAMTGKEPARVYRVVKTLRGDPAGETGDFLEFVRTFVGYASVALPDIAVRGKHSLSKIVREVLRERKQNCAIQQKFSNKK